MKGRGMPTEAAISCEISEAAPPAASAATTQARSGGRRHATQASTAAHAQDEPSAIADANHSTVGEGEKPAASASKSARLSEFIRRFFAFLANDSGPI